MTVLQHYAPKSGVLCRLCNPLYKGIVRRGDMTYTGIVPAIVDAETSKAAQESLLLHPRTLAENHLLTGLLRYALCGGAMIGP